MSELSIENIEKVLDEKVRPGLALHGGNIAVESLNGNALEIRLTGNCSNCLSSDQTIETLVRTELKKAFPELGEITQRTGVSDALIAEALAMLAQRHRS